MRGGGYLGKQAHGRWARALIAFGNILSDI